MENWLHHTNDDQSAIERDSTLRSPQIVCLFSRFFFSSNIPRLIIRNERSIDRSMDQFLFNHDRVEEKNQTYTYNTKWISSKRMIICTTEQTNKQTNKQSNITMRWRRIRRYKYSNKQREKTAFTIILLYIYTLTHAESDRIGLVTRPEFLRFLFFGFFLFNTNKNCIL